MLKDGDIDLVTLDIMLPTDDVDECEGGLTLLRNLRQGRYGIRNASIPVIVVSAASNDLLELIKESESSSNTCFYSKPATIEGLAKIIKEKLRVANS